MEGKIISKKVYIGNIPYTANKEEVESLLRIVGPVINFELNYDKEAKEKKHKGFGFCEYPDYETALSAIRNLNDLEFQSRCLKVGFEAKPEQTNLLKPQHSETDFDPIAFESKNENKTLSEILSNLDKTQKYFIMRELKNIKELVEPELKKILSLNPELSKEILKMQKELGLDNIHSFEKGTNPNKVEKKMKIIKKKSPKKTISKQMINSNMQKEKSLKHVPNQNQTQQLIEKAFQDHVQMENYHSYKDNLAAAPPLMNEPNQLFLNENIFPNPNINVNQNRMFFNVNQTLLMDLQQSQNSSYQNEFIKRALAQKNPIQNYSQNFRPNPSSQIPNLNMQQKYIQQPQFPLFSENEKKWSVSESTIERNDPSMAHHIMESEKIKKKNYYSDFNNNLNNIHHPHQNQNSYYENIEDFNEDVEEAEFSPTKFDKFEFTEDLKNILMDDEAKEFHN